jgi:hypothetical protein
MNYRRMLSLAGLLAVYLFCNRIFGTSREIWVVVAFCFAEAALVAGPFVALPRRWWRHIAYAVMPFALMAVGFSVTYAVIFGGGFVMIAQMLIGALASLASAFIGLTIFALIIVVTIILGQRSDREKTLPGAAIASWCVFLTAVGSFCAYAMRFANF